MIISKHVEQLVERNARITFFPFNEDSETVAPSGVGSVKPGAGQPTSTQIDAEEADVPPAGDSTAGFPPDAGEEAQEQKTIESAAAKARAVGSKSLKDIVDDIVADHILTGKTGGHIIWFTNRFSIFYDLPSGRR